MDSSDSKPDGTPSVVFVTKFVFQEKYGNVVDHVWSPLKLFDGRPCEQGKSELVGIIG